MPLPQPTQSSTKPTSIVLQMSVRLGVLTTYILIFAVVQNISTSPRKLALGGMVGRYLRWKGCEGGGGVITILSKTR